MSLLLGLRDRTHVRRVRPTSTAASASRAARAGTKSRGAAPIAAAARESSVADPPRRVRTPTVEPSSSISTARCSTRIARWSTRSCAAASPRRRVTFGHVITDECERLGIPLDDYVAAYDPSTSRRSTASSSCSARSTAGRSRRTRTGRWARDELAALRLGARSGVVRAGLRRAEALEVVSRASDSGATTLSSSATLATTARCCSSPASATSLPAGTSGLTGATATSSLLVPATSSACSERRLACTDAVGRGGGGMARPPIITRGPVAAAAAGRRTGAVGFCANFFWLRF